MTLSDIYIERSNYLSPDKLGLLLNPNDLDQKIQNYFESKEHFREYIDNVLIPMLEKEIKENEAYRNKIIQIKRKVFNEKTIESLSQELFINSLVKESLDSYIEKRSANLLLLEKIEKKYWMQIEEEYQSVKKLFNNESLYNTLVMTNQNIKVSLDRFLSRNTMDKKDKKVLIRLISFLTRVAKKCSPLGDITLTKICGFEKANTGKKMFVRINYAILSKWWDSISKNELFRTSKKYVTSPLIRIDQDKIYNTVLIDNDSGHLTKTKVQIKAYTEKIADYLTTKGSINLFQFEETFKTDLSKESIKQIWNYLIDEQLLIFEAPLDDQSDQFLNSIIIECGKFPELEDITRALSNLEAAAIDLEEDFRLDKLLVVEECMAIINRLLPIEKFMELHHIYFDYVQASSENNCEIHEFDELLYLLQLALLSFDPEVKRRILMGEVFKEYYPKGVKGKNQILTALKKIGESPEINDPRIMEMYFSNYDFNHQFTNERVNNLHKLSQAVLGLIRPEQMEQKQIQISMESLQELANHVKGNIPDYRLYSQNVFSQMSDDLMIINHIYPGQGMFFNRFTKYFDKDIQKEYTEKHSLVTCDKRVFDIQSSFGFNANVRFSLTGKKLVLPYSNKRESSYTLDDLTMIYDNDKKAVGFNLKQERARPLFLGTLVITATPVPVGMLNTLGSNSAPLSNYFEMLFEDKKLIEHLPRIGFTNNRKEVVISREKWKIDTSILGQLKIRDFSSWFSLQEIFRENSIPRRFYMRSGEKKDFNSINEKGHSKPQFINLASPSSVDLFIRAVQNHLKLIIEEELPVNEFDVAKELILESPIKNAKQIKSKKAAEGVNNNGNQKIETVHL